MIGDDAPGQSQCQADCMIGHVGCAVVGRVADGDAVRGAGGDRDLVEAYAGTNDESAALEPGHERIIEHEVVVADDGIAGPPRIFGDRSGFPGPVDAERRAGTEDLRLDYRLAVKLGVRVQNLESHCRL